MPPTIASPLATGDAGGQFERHVGAYALSLLLVRATPPLLQNSTVVSVAVQTGYRGWKTDDVLIEGEVRPGVSRKLAIQAKRNFTVAVSDEECIKTFQGMWDDFVSPSRFDPTRDRLAVATLHGTAKLLHNFESLLQAARDAADAAGFEQRRAYLSKAARTQYDAVVTILTGRDGVASPTLDRLWEFLRVVHVLALDLGSATAQTEAHVRSLLAFCAQGERDPAESAQLSWVQLLTIVDAGRPSASTWTRDSLPEELRNRHAPVPTAASQALDALVAHGQTVRDFIRGTIAGTFEIDRQAMVSGVLSQLETDRVVVIGGSAGSGKSALAARAVQHLAHDRPILAFRATEFARPHLNATLLETQSGVNVRSMIALLAAHDRVTILVDGVEHLLEADERQAFDQLLMEAQRLPSVRVLLTCRDYVLETMRSALLEQAAIPHSVIVVPELTDTELDAVREGVPTLGSPLGDARLRSLLRTPFLLDLAAKVTWSDGDLPSSVRAFRGRVWDRLVRGTDRLGSGLPARREAVFVEIARKRAVELRPFVEVATNDAEAVAALERASLIVHPAGVTTVYAPAHDVLEDWGIMRWLDQVSTSAGDAPSEQATALAGAVDGRPAVRRGLRRWLTERFEIQPEATTEFVRRTMQTRTLPQYFRDDCAVAALLSDAAPTFLAACRAEIIAGDRNLLRRLRYLLRVACKSLPVWSPQQSLPSTLLQPSGPAWVPFIELIADLETELGPDALVMLGVLEDWASTLVAAQEAPAGADAAGRLLAALLPAFANDRRDEIRTRILQVMLRIPRHVPGFPQLLERAQQDTRSDAVAQELSDLIANGVGSEFMARAFPNDVVAIVRAVILIHSVPDYAERYSTSHVDDCFGVRERGATRFFPPSAWQGPFLALLTHDPSRGLEFILGLLNHAGEWYGEQRYPSFSIEPAGLIGLRVADRVVEQWMNPRLFLMYRGMSVGPNVLQSALMALEAWLLERDDTAGDLDETLLDILTQSNSVMATGVVTSVCIARPDRTPRASLAVLSSPELILSDKSRKLSESRTGADLLTGLLPNAVLHEHERKASQHLPHRQHDLEALAQRMQRSPHQVEIEALLDTHHENQRAGGVGEDPSWPITLARIDLRTYRRVDAPPGGPTTTQDGEALEYWAPTLEPELQQISAASATQMQRLDRYLRVLNWGYHRWNRETSDDGTWQSMLLEAQELSTMDPPEETYAQPYAATAAAVFLRDHRAALEADDVLWCIRQLQADFARDEQFSGDDILSGRRSSMDTAAPTLLIPVAIWYPDRLDSSRHDVLVRALTHPSDVVRDAVYAGASLLTEADRPVIIRIAAAAIAAAQAKRRVEEAQQSTRFYAGPSAEELRIAAQSAMSEVLLGSEGDALARLGEISFDWWHSRSAVRRVARLLEPYAAWPEAQAFFGSVIAWLATTWRDHRRGQPVRHYELEHELSERASRFLLQLPVEAASTMVRPLLDAVATAPNEVALFMKDLTYGTDGSSGDCFWDLWQAFAEAAVGAPWIATLGEERHSVPLIDALFLNGGWRAEATHWPRLDGFEDRVPSLLRRLPPAAACLNAFLGYLVTIGQGALPAAFVDVHNLLTRADIVACLRYKSVWLNLETLLGRSVYALAHVLKRDRDIRVAVLALLDILVSAGSASAWRMRDDFVTPTPPRVLEVVTP